MLTKEIVHLRASNWMAETDFNRQLLLTADEAASLCRTSTRTWRSWDAGGKIPLPIRIGRAKLWRREELEAWIDAGCPERALWHSRK